MNKSWNYNHQCLELTKLGRVSLVKEKVFSLPVDHDIPGVLGACTSHQRS